MRTLRANQRSAELVGIFRHCPNAIPAIAREEARDARAMLLARRHRQGFGGFIDRNGNESLPQASRLGRWLSGYAKTSVRTIS
jgi:hypothetical protein